MKSKGKTILVAEDDSFVSDIYCTKLKQEGYSVVAAVNGKEAIEKIQKKKPDLILLDLVMPYVDGFEVLEKIKSGNDTKNIPVILLTNLSQKEYIDRGIQMGAQGYLVKSHFTPQEVREKIEKVLEEGKNEQE